MINPFLCRITENVSASGDSIAFPPCKIFLGKDFIVPTKSFNFEQTWVFSQGPAKDVMSSAIVEEKVEGFNPEALSAPSPNFQVTFFGKAIDER